MYTMWVFFKLFNFFIFNHLFLASSPTPSEKENSTILAHMHMSLRNQEMSLRSQEMSLRSHHPHPHHHHPAGQPETKAAQFPPSMQYMGMSHFQNWQLAAH